MGCYSKGSPVELQPSPTLVVVLRFSPGTTNPPPRLLFPGEGEQQPGGGCCFQGKGEQKEHSDFVNSGLGVFLHLPGEVAQNALPFEY